MTEPTLTPTPETSRLRGPGALRVLAVGVASIALAIAAAVAPAFRILRRVSSTMASSSRVVPSCRGNPTPSAPTGHQGRV